MAESQNFLSKCQNMVTIHTGISSPYCGTLCRPSRRWPRSATLQSCRSSFGRCGTICLAAAGSWVYRTYVPPPRDWSSWSVSCWTPRSRWRGVGHRLQELERNWVNDPARSKATLTSSDLWEHRLATSDVCFTWDTLYALFIYSVKLIAAK